MNQQKLALLFALQAEPNAPAVSLAKKIGVSPPTARAWLDDLREEQVYGGVQASLRVRKLGLEFDDFLVQTDSFDNIVKIEKFCDAHPYTSYRARVFGGRNQGLLLQFRQPDAARDLLLESLGIMMDNGLITDVRELPTLSAEYGSSYTRPILAAWDSEKMVWNFDWDKWWTTSGKSLKLETVDPAPEAIAELDTLDVRLLEELTKNARRKNTEIIETIGMDKDEMGVQQKVSQKIKRLEAEVIESYRVFINWTHFDVYNTPLVIADTKSEDTDRLIAHLQSGEFPFGSTIRKTSTGFIWSARLPSAHLSEMIALVWKLTKRYELLIIDYKHSELYGLWAETFDGDNRTWKIDRKFCMDEPLKSIGFA